MSEFYVYMYLDQDNVPFYIGKGKGDRYLVSKHSDKRAANRFLKNKIRKVGSDDIKIVFLHKDITEEEAFKWERYWIKYIGRRDLKEGSLCNLTDGGEGDSGYTHSDESRKKMSKALKGRTPWNKGKKMSKEYCKRNSEAHKGLRTGEDHPMYGKTHTDEAKRKVSIANKGKPAVNKGKTHTKEAKKKMRGRIVSEETREKIRKTKRARSILNKNRNK